MASGSHSGKALAMLLCVLLAVFMTAEAAHHHAPPGVLQHASCSWCSSAHSATILIFVLPSGPSGNAGEAVALLDHAEKPLLLIPLQLIRPPPISFQL
jgi:hypothetical protein